MKSLKKNIPNVLFNIDPIEIDKFGYHNGVVFKFYSSGFQELINGGNYNINDENCVGFSGLVENLIKESSSKVEQRKKIFIPYDEKKVDRIKYISLPNLMLNKKVLPEFLQKDASVINLVDQLSRLLDESNRNKIKFQLAKLKSSLKIENAAEKAASSVLSILN